MERKGTIDHSKQQHFSLKTSGRTRDGFVGKTLSTRASGPEFGFLPPTQKLGTVVGIYDPRTVKRMETGRSLEFIG